MKLKLFADADFAFDEEYFQGRFVSYHRRYNLGHELSDKEKRVFADSNSFEEAAKRLGVSQDTAVMLPVYLYDHSGLTLSTVPFSCPWDSGQVGFVYMSLESIRKSFNVGRVSAKLRLDVMNTLVREIAQWDSFVKGEVWFASLEDDSGSVVDEMSGIVGHSELNAWLQSNGVASIDDIDVSWE